MTYANPRLAAIAFAESLHASSALGLTKPQIIDGVRRFLLACYEDAGVAPAKLDGDQLQEIVLVHLARRCFPRDVFVPGMADLLQAFFADLEERTVVSHAFEIKRTLDELGDRFE